ncbi:MAG: succinate dehydrogenase cytochrome b subunit [Bacteroidota bacterium]|nr:succinate dehydrogenase cytochrome b subunit [Bacteroidota bacterium]
MSWASSAFTSSLGKKYVVGITGLFLCSFLVVHCGINSLIFFNDGGYLFNMGAEFMGTNWIIRTMEIVLFLGLITHIVQTLMLYFENKKARPIAYSVIKNQSTWYSRSMALLGTLLLIFLIIHLKHFWVVSRFTDHITSGEETLFDEMKEVFENPLVVVVYVLAQFSLGYHLLHGFQSAFQSLGFNHAKYSPLIKFTGKAFSIVVPTLFALMPIVMYFKIIQ